MKIYIAGRIRGNDNYIEQFGKAEEHLKAQGFIVLNPAHNPEGMTRLEYMKIDIPLLSIADTIYLLKGWQQSEGACLERHYAEYTGKVIVEEMIPNSNLMSKALALSIVEKLKVPEPDWGDSKAIQQFIAKYRKTFEEGRK